MIKSIIKTTVLQILFFTCLLTAQENYLEFDITCDMREFAGPDFQDSKFYRGACEAINKIGAGEFMVSPGDIDPPWHVKNTIDSVITKEGYFWYPSIGNHERETVEDMDYLRKYLSGEIPNLVRRGPENSEETMYSFSYGNVHFAVVNQYYDGESDAELWGDMSDPTLEWLKNDLEQNSKPIIFVVGHEPIVSLPDYENGRHRHKGDNLDEFPENNAKFQKLLREFNVTAYICGHTHNFSIAKLNDIWQIDAGHARGIGDNGARSTFLKVKVLDEKVTIEVYRSLENWIDYELTNTFVLE